MNTTPMNHEETHTEIFQGYRIKGGRQPISMTKSEFAKAHILNTRQVDLNPDSRQPQIKLSFTQHLAIWNLQPVEIFVMPKHVLPLLSMALSDFDQAELIKWQ